VFNNGERFNPKMIKIDNKTLPIFLSNLPFFFMNTTPYEKIDNAVEDEVKNRELYY